jgi:hypothetical protein
VSTCCPRAGRPPGGTELELLLALSLLLLLLLEGVVPRLATDGDFELPHTAATTARVASRATTAHTRTLNSGL